MPESNLKIYVLYELEILFNGASSTLAFYKLPLLNEASMRQIQNKLFTEQLDYDSNELKIQHDEMLPKLNKEQHDIYDQLLSVALSKKPFVFFVHGDDGEGKTCLWFVIILKIRSERLMALAVDRPVSHHYCFQEEDQLTQGSKFHSI